MSRQARPRTIGDREMALLQFIGEHRQVTVAEAAAGFGQPLGLARSTVLTMMERLRKKGYLTRRPAGGVYQYAARSAPGITLRRAVRTFVDRTLGGSIAPFVAYLGERQEISDEEIAELEAVLARLQRKRPKNE